MKQVMKKYPGTKWADLAAYHLIDNKLCGDWEALATCPEKETISTSSTRTSIRNRPRLPRRCTKRHGGRPRSS